MKKEIILSIIIPSYNIEKYVDQAAEPYLNCKISDKIEVIFVNDGSTDNTKSIINKYVKNYPNIFQQIEKENGGHGSTINVGIQIARGTYFKVVDGDDWLDPIALFNVVKKLETNDVDMIITNFTVFREESKQFLPEKKININFDIVQSIENICNYSLFPFHALIYKTELLKKNSIKLDEKCFYVDAEFIVYPLIYVNTVLVIDEYLYIYRMGHASQSVSRKGFIKYRKDQLLVLQHLIDYYKTHQNNISEIMKNYIIKLIINHIKLQYTILFFHYPSSNIKKEFIIFDQYIIQVMPELYEKVASRKTKVVRKSNYKLFYPVMVISSIFKK